MKSVRLYVNILDGVFEFISPEFANGKLNELPNGAYTFTIESANKRSSRVNRYLHGVVFQICFDALRDAGFNEIKDLQDAKDFVKQKFLSVNVVNENTGEVIGQIVKHTADLNQEETTEFIEDIAQWLAEYFSIELPPPNTQSKLFAV